MRLEPSPPAQAIQGGGGGWGGQRPLEAWSEGLGQLGETFLSGTLRWLRGPAGWAQTAGCPRSAGIPRGSLWFE